MMRIYNRTRSKLIAENAVFAVKWQDRLRGMIARRFDDSLDAMFFPRCNAIHTFFMAIPLDVLFVSRDGFVLKKTAGLRPWHPCVACPGAAGVIELPAGSAAAETGDVLEWNRTEYQ